MESAEHALPRLQQLTAHFGRALDAMLQRLLRKDPVDRYQSAAALVFDVDDRMEIMREEIFGPLLPVVSYGTQEEALAYVNAHLPIPSFRKRDKARVRMVEMISSVVRKRVADGRTGAQRADRSRPRIAHALRAAREHPLPRNRDPRRQVDDGRHSVPPYHACQRLECFRA